MGIQKLSQELWDHVVLATQDSDWKSLRLVCRSFEHQASACLFFNISVCLQKASLDRLIGIAESPRLSQHVRTLTTGDEILSKYTPISPESFIAGLQKVYLGIAAPGDWRHQNVSWDYFQRVGFEPFPESTYPQSLIKIGINRQRAFELYAMNNYELYQHSKLINQNLDIWFLAAAFSKLESLSTVHLSISNSTKGKQSWGSTSDCAYILASGENHDRQLHVFLGAAAACSPAMKITSLIIDDDVEGRAVTVDRGIGEISNYLIRAALPSFSCISHLDIPFGEYSESVDQGRDSAVFRIAELLRVMPLLQRFSLRSNERKGIFPVEVANILAAITSKRMQSINLEGCLYRAHRLKAFLMKHGATLRKIEIRRAFLTGCSFESLFCFMHNRLLLEDLILDSFFVELNDEQTVYHSSTEFMRAKKDDSREAISAFATRQSAHYPSDAVEKDSRFIILGTSSVPSQ